METPAFRTRVSIRQRRFLWQGKGYFKRHRPGARWRCGCICHRRHICKEEWRQYSDLHYKRRTQHSWSSSYINDRDSRGPTGNTYSLAELENTFNTAGVLPGGLTTSQLITLKTQAQTNGYYNGNPGNGVTIQQSNVPNRAGDLVVYVEFPSGNPQNNRVDLKFKWPPNGYTTGKMLVVVRNGSIDMEGSAIGSIHRLHILPRWRCYLPRFGKWRFLRFRLG